MAHHHKVDCLVTRLDFSVVVKVKVTGKVQNSSVHLNDISSVAEPSATKFGMVMQHHGPKCRARRLVSCLQVQGHSEGSCDQIWLLCICWAADLFGTKFGWYIMISWSVLCKKKKKNWLLFSRSRSQWRFKTFLNLYASYIFCTTDLLATKEGVLIYYS